MSECPETYCNGRKGTDKRKLLARCGLPHWGSWACPGLPCGRGAHCCGRFASAMHANLDCAGTANSLDSLGTGKGLLDKKDLSHTSLFSTFFFFPPRMSRAEANAEKGLTQLLCNTRTAIAPSARNPWCYYEHTSKEMNLLLAEQIGKYLLEFNCLQESCFLPAHQCARYLATELPCCFQAKFMTSHLGFHLSQLSTQERMQMWLLYFPMKNNLWLTSYVWARMWGEAGAALRCKYSPSSHGKRKNPHFPVYPGKNSSP